MDLHRFRSGQVLTLGGSGTSLIAAETTGRHCHAVELDPAYVDVAVQRWQDFTGKQAVLAGQGTSFAEVAAARVGETTQPIVESLAYCHARFWNCQKPKKPK